MFKSEKDFLFQRYLSIRSARDATFSPDGKRIAFLTDITGIHQVWCREFHHSGWAEQLTFFDERVSFVKYSPREELLIFGMDKGGDERTQLYLLSSDASIIINLSESPSVIHKFGSWSNDGKYICFSNNEREEAYFDVYIQNIKTGAKRRVLTRNASNFAHQWSPQDDALIIEELINSFDQNLYLLNLTTGEIELLTPHSDEYVVYKNPRFDSSGRGIYFLTDMNREFLNLAYLDLATKRWHYLTDENWDIVEFELSPDSRKLAMVVNQEGYSKLKLFYPQTNKIEEINHLPGIITELEFSKDANDLLYTFHSPTFNPDIWVLNLTSGHKEQITFSSRAGLIQESFLSPELICYPTFDGREIPAFLYISPYTGEKKKPAIIHIHGGPESQELPGFYAFYQLLLHEGYAILAPNVRGSTGYGKDYMHLDDVYKREDSVKDIYYAFKYLSSHPQIDGTRIGVMGASYGGYMTLASITLYPDLWKAAIEIVGIANFNTFLRNTGSYRRKWRIAEYGDPQRDYEFLESISPLNRVAQIVTPLLIIHGANDPRVPVSEAYQLSEALKGRGVPVETLIFEDEGHGIKKLSNRLIAYKVILNFLNKYMLR